MLVLALQTNQLVHRRTYDGGPHCELAGASYSISVPGQVRQCLEGGEVAQARRFVCGSREISPVQSLYTVSTDTLIPFLVVFFIPYVYH